VTPNLILCQAVNKLLAHMCHKTAVRTYSTVAHPGQEDDVGSNMNILKYQMGKAVSGFHRYPLTKDVTVNFYLVAC